jgi:proline iminopeptidase
MSGYTIVPPCRNVDSTVPDFRTKYGPIEKNDSGFLQVSPLHNIYWEESGNKDGQPVVVLHGGPGGGCPPSYRSYFDPAKYRIVMFDQRGAGQSTPLAELRENTTWDLVADIERIREMLGIDKWVVFGGSWGSTLSMAYSQTHPDRVKAIVLRGIFMCRRSEIQFFYQEGSSQLFPDYFEKFRDHIPLVEQTDLVAAYHRRVTSDDPKVRLAASMQWTGWEMATSNLLVDPDKIAEGEDPDFAESFARIELHYFVNQGFLRHNQFFEDLDRIRNIPTTIVHGRYDVVCPIKTCWELHKAWPEADLKIVSDSGHSMSEPGIVSELIKATDKYSNL